MKLFISSCCTVLLALWSRHTSAQDFSVEGFDGHYTITGYFGSGGAVNIPNTIYGWTVTEIADDAFSALYSPDIITSITIPDTVTRIGARAFYECSGLTNVVMGNGVTSVGEEAFNECAGLSSFIMGNSLWNIPDYMFSYCSSLSSLTIPNSVTNIGEAAFFQCSGLTNLNLGTNLLNIGFDAFSYCGGLTNVTFPARLTGIGDGAFYQCSGMARAVIPNSVISIGADAFYSCAGLTNLIIGTNVTDIGEYAFRACTLLSSVTIPNSVTNVGMDAFYSCTGVTSLKLGTGLRTIGSWAFTYCNPTSIIVPGCVTNIGDYALSGLYNLRTIYFTGMPPALGSAVFQADNATVYYLPKMANWGASFGGLPAVLWDPQPQTGDGSFGVRTNRFGFNITGNPGLVVVVVASTNLTNPIWTPVVTNTLTGGNFYFSDPKSTNYSGRFYRLRSP